MEIGIPLLSVRDPLEKFMLPVSVALNTGQSHCKGPYTKAQLLVGLGAPFL